LRDSKVFKCPACGYDPFNNERIGPQMNKILKSKNKKTIKLLNKIASLIMANIPSESRKSYSQFLYGIKDVEDKVIQYAIERFYQSRHYLSGKGFAYLRTICLNRGKNIEIIKKNERNRIGSTPPVYKGEI
tara:strand:+ start:1053 stop:1445 length:393 start_codon:yes stop_codon:yes gene_type:complete